MARFNGIPIAETDGGSFGGIPVEEADGTTSPKQESLGVGDTLSLLGRNVWDAVVYHTPAAVASAIEGDAPYATKDWKDSLIERARKRSQEVSAGADSKQKTALPWTDVGDLNNLGPSLGFSVAGAGAGLGAGIPAAVAGNFVAPVVGTAAGYSAGAAASGKVAYNMATNQFIRDLHDAANEESIKATGNPISDQQFQEKQAQLADTIKSYGLWEAVPEAAGNALSFGILTAPVKGAVGKLFGKNIATRFAGKMGALYGEELATETTTQMGQHNAEVDAGLDNGPKREFTSPTDWGDSLREVAAPTILQTTLMAGGFKAGQMAKNRFVGNNDQPQPDAATTSGQYVNAADVLGTPAEKPAPATEAEQALYTPKTLTALDRVGEIDTKLADLESSVTGKSEQTVTGQDGKPVTVPAEQPSFFTAEQKTEYDTLKNERDHITESWPKAVPGVQTTFSTETGARLDGQYALMESGDLTTSHDESLRPVPTYPKELQPRERERQASELQVQQIVQKLDPARLGESADVATGAPIVGADGLVESGNARTIALKRVYQANGQKAENYKQFLKDNADRFGITPESVDAMHKPVLVRVRTTPVNRAEFARQANQSTVARMSTSEQARADSAMIDSLDDLTPDDNGDFMSGNSRPFVRRFMAKLPTTEQSGMVDGDGQLSQAGYSRIRNAVLAKAYGDSPVLLRMVESLDNNLRNVSAAMMRVAPQVAKARESIKEGALFDADITPDLMAAVEELSALKDKGVSVAQALAQVGMFGDKLTPEAQELLAFLDQNIRSPRRIAEFIQSYFDALTAAGNPAQGTLLGDTAAPAKGELLAAVKKDNDGGTTENTGRGQRGENQAPDQQDQRQPENAASDRGSNQSNEVSATGEWVAFPADSGTLGIPRAEMPQVKSDHRGALIQFLDARGIGHKTVDIPASKLKPTQAEFSTKKAAKWSEVREGVDRSVLASSDGYILDGHHQWVSALANGETEQVIQFDAPIRELLAAVFQFPSVGRSDGTGVVEMRAQDRQDFKDALADLAQIATRHTRAAMLPENTPNLMPTLVKLSGAAIREVGYQIKDIIAYVKQALKQDAQFKTFWGKIGTSTYRKAAEQAAQQESLAHVDDLFAVAEQRKGQQDLFSPQATPKKADVAMIDGRPYDMKRDNYKPFGVDTFLPANIMARVDEVIKKHFTAKADAVVTPEDQAKAMALLKPAIDKASAAKAEFDQKVIDIAKQTGAIGQMLADVKGAVRAVPKLVHDYQFDVGMIMDLLRSTIVVNSYDEAQSVVDAISDVLDVVRVKNLTKVAINSPNLSNMMPKAGYQSVMLNVRMPNGVVAEIQINTPAMLAAIYNQGHDLYEAERVLPDGDETRLTIESVERELYQAAASFDATGGPEAKTPLRGRSLRGSSSDKSNEKMNTRPSGNLTQSSPLDDTTNSQPSGNLSGTFISSTSEESIAKTGADDYAGNDKKINGDINGKAQSGKQSATDTGTAKLSRSQSTRQQFEQRIDELFSGESANRVGAVALDRSDVLDMLGMGNKPVLVAEHKVITSGTNHGLTAEHWKKIPEWLDSPAAVFDSDTQPGRLVFVAPEQINGNPVVMIIEPDAKVENLNIHLLVNAYDKTGGRMPVRRWVNDGLIRYIDKAKSRQLLASSGLQLSGVMQKAIGSKLKIYTDGDLVKYRANTDKLARMERSIAGRMRAEDVRAVVEGFRKAAQNLPAVHPLQGTKDAPRNVQKWLRENDAMDDAAGLFHDGEIYLFAAHLKDVAHAQHVFLHEAQHYGLTGLFGNALDESMLYLYRHNGQLKAKADAKQKSDRTLSTVRATEEALADMAGEGKAKMLNGWDKLVAAVRDWFRMAGWVKNVTDADVSYLVYRAELYWKRAQKTGYANVKRGELSRVQIEETPVRSTGFDKSSGTVVADFKNDQPLKANADYKAAKAGDVEAAARLVQALVKSSSIDAAKVAFGDDVIYLPVHAEEASGRNKIPNMLAMLYSERAGGDVGSGVFQTNRAFHTGANAMERLLSRAEFSGKVEPGRRYVLVDDVTTMGSTLADLANYIRSQGGEVAGSVVLVNAARNGILTPVSKTIKELEVRHGEEISKLFGIEPSALTASESQYLLGFRTTDELRNRVVKARSERSARLRAKGIPESQNSPGTVEPRLSRAATAGQNLTPEQNAEAIIQQKAGTPRPLESILKGVTQAVRIDKLTTAAYNKAGALLDRYTPETIKAGFVADYGIPEAVTDQRAMMQGRQRQQLRATGALLEKLSTLTRAESRVAYEWMNADDPQSADYFREQLPPESIKTLAEVEKMIDGLSKEAVRLGQLDPEAYKRNRFAYLHRSYAKHTAELSKGESAARKRAIAILGDQYKGRGMTDAVAMAKVKNSAPEWWGRKLKAGQADKQLKGEQFVRLERRAAVGAGTQALPGMTDKGKGRLMEVAYWPANEPMSAKYQTWDHAGTWEARDTKGNNLVLWRDFTKQEREALGEIDEVRYAVAKTLHNMIHDVETGKYLEWLSQRYAKKEGEAIDGTVVEASERMRDTFKPGEWAKVPDSVIPGTKVKKYGVLAGRYLPGPIWNDVRQVVGFRYQPFGETYAAILRFWKTSKTALSPAVHMNNVMANFVMADWHDVTAGHVLKALKVMTSKDAAAQEVMNRYGDSGGTIGTWAAKELQQEQLRPLLEALEKELGVAGNVTGQVGVMSALQLALKGRFPSAWDAFKPSKTGQVAAKAARAMTDMYEAEDQVFRLAAWLKAKEDGATDLAAGKVARKSFLDYSINAPWVQMMRSTALPFVAFTYRAVPMMLDTAAKKPWKLMKLGLIAGALNMLGYAMSGGDEDDERKLLPEEKAGRIWGLTPKLVRMPWNDANNSPVFLDVRRWIPVGDIFDTGQTHSALPMLPALVPGGPLATLAELVLNKVQFTGKEIVLETDTPAEKAQKLADHLYKAFAPNIILLPGTYAFTGAINAGTGKTDTFGREQSLAQSVVSAFGVKVGSYPKDVLQLNAQRAAQAKMMEIDRNITALKREYQKNGLTSEEFQKKAQVQMEKKRAVMEDLQGRIAGGGK